MASAERRRHLPQRWRSLPAALLAAAAAVAWCGRATVFGAAFAAGRLRAVSEALEVRSSGSEAVTPRVRVKRPTRRTSEFRGVSWHDATNQWQAHIPDPVTAEPVNLGLFNSELDAAKAWDLASLALEAEVVDTNFPREEYRKTDIRAEAIRLKDYWRPRPSDKYYGVYQTRGSKRWKAEIELFGITQFLDFYAEEQEAAEAVDNALRSTGIPRAVLLQRLNIRRDEDYFSEETWEQETVPKGASSRFLGVSYHQPSGQFLAKLGRKHIGLFDTEDAAAHAFDEASNAVGGRTNFRPT